MALVVAVVVFMSFVSFCSCVSCVHLFRRSLCFISCPSSSYVPNFVYLHLQASCLPNLFGL